MQNGNAAVDCKVEMMTSMNLPFSCDLPRSGVCSGTYAEYLSGSSNIVQRRLLLGPSDFVTSIINS